MKIRQKLIYGFFAVSLLVGLVGFLGLYANSQIVTSFEKGEEHFGSIIEASNEVSSYTKRAQGHTMLYLTLHNGTDKKKASDRIASLREQIAIMEGIIQNPDALKLLNDSKSRTNEMQYIIESLIELHDKEMERTGTFDFKNHETLIRNLDKVASNIRQNGLELGALELRLEEELHQKAKQKAASSYYLIFIISGIALISALVIGILIDRSISNPINKLKNAAIKIRNGDLGTNIDITSKDEIGELSNEFNKMAQDLHKSSDEITSSKEYTDNIVNSMNDSLIVASHDGIIKRVNNATILLLGYTKEELIGQHISSFIINGDKLLLDMCDIDKKNIVKNVETSFMSKGKTEISIIFSSSIMYDKYGNIQDFVCVAKDITERKRTEEAIRSNEGQLKEAQRIAHIGSWELNIRTGELKWSDEIYRMFGMKPQEFCATYEGFLDTIHPDDRDFVNRAYTDSLKYRNPYNIIHRLLRRDGSIKIVHERCETVYDENGTPIRSMGTVQDITERKLAENQIEQSLREKEVLLREIHHRVKNNMQIISSLLSHQMENIKDNKIIDIFTESQNRIISMSLVHEKLYQSRDLRNIDLKDYINDLGVNLFQSYNIHSGNIKLNIDVEDILLDIDLAIPIGLILNELITNSLKYAFPDGMKGEIKVLFRSTNDNMLELVVNDNGIGLPEDLDFRKTRTLGLHLVTVLAENQLHGKIEMNRFKGTEFRIKFRGIKS